MSARNRTFLIMLTVALMVVFGLSGRVSTQEATAAQTAEDQRVMVGPYQFDPLGPDLRTVQSLTEVPLNAGQKGLYLLQFEGIPNDAKMDAVAAFDVTYVQYIPNNAYIVWTSPQALQRADGLAEVRWTGSFYSEMRSGPNLSAIMNAPNARDEEVSIAVDALFIDDGSLDDLQSQIEAAGGRIHYRDVTALMDESLPAENWSFDTGSGTLDLLRNWPSLVAMQQYFPPQIDDPHSAAVQVTGDLSQYSLYGRETGIDGSGVKVAILDTGVDWDHPDLNVTSGQEISPNAYQEPGEPGSDGGPNVAGHGTHVAGITAGTGTTVFSAHPGAPYGLGVAPGAQLHAVDYLSFLASNDSRPALRTMLSNALAAGATLSNNSYGGEPGTGYTESDRRQDEAALDVNPGNGRREPFTQFFSAGNDGNGVADECLHVPGGAPLPCPNSVGANAEAKNVIVVGSTDSPHGPPNYGNFEGQTGVVSHWYQNIHSISYFSSRGPALDGRIKPDVVGVGNHIISTRNTDGFPNTSCDNTEDLSPIHSWCGGTSMSTPSVTGVGALFTQFWRELVGNPSANPEPATVKAALIATAQRLAGTGYGNDGYGTTLVEWPNMHEGWGQVNANNFINPTYPILYFENPVVLNDTGAFWDINVRPAASGVPMKFVLVWSDPPASTTNAGTGIPALVNDLDLVVTRQGSTETFWGNNFEKVTYKDSLNCTAPGCSRDELNNVEVVLVKNPANANVTNNTYNIRVNAFRIAANGNVDEGGVPEYGDNTDQIFSLVCVNCVEAYYVDQRIDDGLLAYWKFDEGEGTQVQDSAGNGFNLTINNATNSLVTSASTPSIFANHGSLLTSGANPPGVANRPEFYPSDELTISMWAKPNSLPAAGQRMSLFSGCCEGGSGYTLHLDEFGRIIFRIYDDDAAFVSELTSNDSIKLVPNQWAHVAATWTRAGSIHIYINGAQVASDFGWLPPLGTSTSPVEIGRRFNGFLDEVRFYTRSLSYVEVLRLANGYECESSGASWGEAFPFVSCGLDAAKITGGEVRVAEGYYTPGANRLATFKVYQNTTLKGGYVGTRDNARNWQVYPTKLSGDLDFNDGLGVEGLTGRNSYHVVTVTGNGSLDGLIVQNGLANGPTYDHNEGAGISNYSPFTRTFSNLIVRDNLALKGGGGLKSWGEGRLLLYQVAFLGNKATTGGGADFQNTNGAHLVNQVFSGNQAAVAAGMIYSTNGNLSIVNSTFAGNAASYYGGIGVFGTPRVSIFSSIFHGNRAALDSQFHLPVAASVTNSIIEGGYGGNNNLAVDPLFADPDGEDNTLGTIDDNLHLTRNSPAIDTGGTCTGADFAGMSRQFDGNFDKIGVCDRGAYEYGTILVVDDEPEIPGELTYVLSGLEAAGLAYEVWASEPGPERLSGHSRVLWFTGKHYDETGQVGPSTGPSETTVANWLDRGPRCMLLSSRTYFTSHGAPGAFAQNYFGLNPTGNQSNFDYKILHGEGPRFKDRFYNLQGGLPYDSRLNDRLAVNGAVGAEVAFNIKDNDPAGGQAGVTLRTNQFRTMFLGFPLGQVSSNLFDAATHRGEILTDFFTECEPVLGVLSNGSLALGVGVDKPIVSDVGELISYTYVITNTGQSDAFGPFTVVDDVVGDTSPCGAGNLPVGGATSCTANYNVTQDDLDAGIISNTAQAFGGAGIKSDTAGATVVADPSELGLVVSTDKERFEQAGETIVFTYAVYNQHDITLSGPFKIEDSGVGTIDNCGSGPLAPGASTSCQKGYLVTQADVDGGSFLSLATASGNGFTSRPQITWPNLAIGELGLEVTPDRTTYNLAGSDEINYTYTIRNNGTATLTGVVTIEDDRFGDITCSTSPIAPGAQASCLNSHTVTESDIAAGSIINRAIATSSDTGGSTDQVTTVVTIGMGSLLLEMSANPQFYSAVDEQITYTYVVKNVSSVPMNGPFSVSDDKVGFVAQCGDGPLQPGEETVCVKKYVVTAADLDAGSITNSATASGNQVTSPTTSQTVDNIDFTNFAYLPSIFNPGNALKQLAFVSDRDGNDEIYIMNEDGSDLFRLTRSPGRDGSPAWSPDGQWLAFFSEREGDAEIYVIRANGTGLRKLTNNSAFDCCMDWSPDGTKIVFNSNWPDGDQDIYVINVNGTGLKNLTDAPGDDWSPDWSPDGSRIAFDSNRDGQSEIYVMNADGSGVSRLTQSPDAQRAPDWSSDGTEIVYSSNEAVASGQPAGVDNLYKMRSNGTQQLLLASSAGDDKWPDWIRNGQDIVFTSYRDGNGEIYTVTSTGSNLKRITTHPANDFGPVWRP